MPPFRTNILNAKWLRFIFSHSLFVSLCASALTFHSSFLVSGSADFPIVGLVFFSTLFSYNAYWILAEWSGAGKSLKVFLFSRSAGLLMMVISLCGILLFLKYDFRSLFFFGLSGILTVVYFLPVMWRAKAPLFKRFGPVKTLLLAFSWSFVTVALPLSNLIFSSQVLLLFCQRFFFMLMLCIVFDARDVQVDKIRSLHSLATRVSAKNLSGIFFLSLSLFVAFTFLVFGKNNLLIPFSFSVFAGFFTVLLFLLSRKPRGYYFYYFLVDGMMLLLAGSSLFCLFFD